MLSSLDKIGGTDKQIYTFVVFQANLRGKRVELKQIASALSVKFREQSKERWNAKNTIEADANL